MSRNSVTLTLATLAVSLAACSASDRHAQAPEATSTGGTGPGVTSGAPAEPDSFSDPPVKPPPSSTNPARRRSPKSEEDLLALRSNHFSEPVFRHESFRAEPARTSGGIGGGNAGSGGTAPVSTGGTTSSGGITSPGGAPSRGGRATTGGSLSAE
ncbi:MAG TPA: hypothetical protein VG937_12835 [Polyangiaceae bacterium]|nr:hypothetical protein [Polyangiaceae bacterium]